MTTFDDLVTEVRATMRGYGLYREQVSFLNGSITNSALSITVDDGTLVRPGVVEIDSESIYVQSVAGNVLTVSPDGRGWDRTTAASHADNARVTVNPPLPTWRIQRAINDTIIGTAPTLFGVGTTTFTYNGVRTTYDLPADCTSLDTGAGAVGNRTIGTSALGGMLFGTIFGVIVIPGLYYIFGSLADGKALIRKEETEPLTESYHYNIHQDDDDEE